jgi:hypothetical protein
VNQFDIAQHSASTVYRLEAKHRTNTLFDGTMILIDPVIQIAALADQDRLQFAS